MAQLKRDIIRGKTSPEIFKGRDIEYYESQLRVAEASLKSLHADLQKTQFEQERKTVRAPYDGQVAVVNVADGSRVGNMHIYDTSRKFLEMRIPDQTYRYVEKDSLPNFTSMLTQAKYSALAYTALRQALGNPLSHHCKDHKASVSMSAQIPVAMVVP